MGPARARYSLERSAFPITIGIPFLQSNIFDSDVRGWRQPNYEYSLFYSKVHLTVTAVQLPFYPSLAWLQKHPITIYLLRLKQIVSFN